MKYSKKNMNNGLIYGVGILIVIITLYILNGFLGKEGFKTKSTKKCNSPKILDTNTNNCVQCYETNIENRYDVEFPKTPYWNGKKCTECPEKNKWWNSESKKCVSCPQKTPYWDMMVNKCFDSNCGYIISSQPPNKVVDEQSKRCVCNPSWPFWDERTQQCVVEK